MTVKRMDNVSIVVEDMEAAIAFFEALGMRLDGRMPIEGPWAGRVVGIDDLRCEIAMMRTPDGHGGIELTSYDTPAAIRAEPTPPPVNTLGLCRVMFEVDDIEATVARLREHGAELVGEIARYENVYLLCYMRAPEGFLVGLAEALS